jgi:hypothetical protein
MNTNIIAIQPVNVWTPTGTKTATKFMVRYVNYQNGPAVADCVLLDANDVEVSAQLVNATEAQTTEWAADTDFYAALAENAGLTPVEVAPST